MRTSLTKILKKEPLLGELCSSPGTFSKHDNGELGLPKTVASLQGERESNRPFDSHWDGMIDCNLEEFSNA